MLSSSDAPGWCHFYLTCLYVCAEGFVSTSMSISVQFFTSSSHSYTLLSSSLSRSHRLNIALTWIDDDNAFFTSSSPQFSSFFIFFLYIFIFILLSFTNKQPSVSVYRSSFADNTTQLSAFEIDRRDYNIPEEWQQFRFGTKWMWCVRLLPIFSRRKRGMKWKVLNFGIISTTWNKK